MYLDRNCGLRLPLSELLSPNLAIRSAKSLYFLTLSVELDGTLAQRRANLKVKVTQFHLNLTCPRQATSFLTVPCNFGKCEVN